MQKLPCLHREHLDLVVEQVLDARQEIPLARPLRVRLSVDAGAAAVLPGDRVHFTTRLRQPRLFGTPGEFNWPRYLAGEKIDMTGWLAHMEQLAVVPGTRPSPARILTRWRSAVGQALSAALPQERAPLVRALVLGEGRQLPDATRRILAGAGVSHLFAISGLHLGLLALFGYQLLLQFYRRSSALLHWQPPQRILPLLLLPLLLAYLLLTGDAVSTRRAFALACAGAVLLLWRYPVNPLNLLALVALVSLLVNPLLLWQAGWQLSFSGAAGILLWRPLWQIPAVGAPALRPLRYLLQMCLVTGAATLATLPWVLFNFHLLAPAGLPANLVCVPLVTLVVLPLGFVGLALFPVAPQLALPLFHLCGGLLELLQYFAAWLAGLPGLAPVYLYLGRMEHLAVALMVLPLLLLPQIGARRMAQAAVLCAALATLLWWAPWQRSAPVSLTMFSVGQGEAMLLQNSSGQNLLVDGGGLYGSRFDVGERLLAPAFGELGVRRLDLVVLTHDHADHWRGLLFLLARFPVGELWLGRPLANYHPDLRAVVEQQQVVTRVVEQGWSQVAPWRAGQLSIFNGSAAADSENNASLVLHLDMGAAAGLLLTGDLEEKGVAHLMRAGLPGPVSVLKLPHHGGRTSYTDRLIDHLRPQLGIVSVGYQNRYRLPHSQVLGHLRARRTPLLRTDEDGTIRVEWTATEWLPRRWQRGLFR
ncbi:MAG: DNA internalization-related competence protein ComEC/Rec2 [Pelovirga sp.]